MLNLIEQYDLWECLWNVISKDYKNQNKKKDAWKEISFHMGIDVDIVEKKTKYLLAHSQHERRKVADTKKCGIGADDIKVPKWFACQRFTFLDGNKKPKRMRIEGNLHIYLGLHHYYMIPILLLYSILTLSRSVRERESACARACACVCVCVLVN
jgi:hypothetical protein